MPVREYVIAFIFIAIQLVACSKDTSPTSRSGDELIGRFEKALLSADHHAAYKMMCPEYTEENDSTGFARSLKTSPYLTKAESFGGGALSTQGGVTERRCVIIGKFGHIPAVLYVRDHGQIRCVISLTVAGIPVAGPGVGRSK